MVLHDDKLGIATADDNGEAWENERLDIFVGINVASQMVDRDQWLIIKHRQGLCRLQSDMEGADEPGSPRDSKSIDFFEFDIGFFQGFFQNDGDVLAVQARSDFRHDTAIFLMDGHL